MWAAVFAAATLFLDAARFLLKGGLRLFDERGERRGVVDRNLREHLAVELHAGLFVFTKEIRYGIIIEEKICCVEEL